MENVREVPIYKADPIGNQEIPDVSILIVGELPDLKGLDEHGELYERQAEKVFKALRSLPGGTWDRLVVKMLEKELSLFRISLFPLSPEEKTIPICYGQDRSVVQTSPETEELVVGCGSSVRTVQRVVRYKEEEDSR